MELRIQTLALAAGLVILLASVQCDVPVTVRTAKGTIEGIEDQKTGVLQFYDIPYSSQANESRWRFLQPNSGWKGTLKANNKEKIIACPQKRTKVRDYVMSEECLTLNIYTTTTDQTANQAVMVWLHGGGYVRGTAKEYDGKYLAKKGVVVVTMNYRLGILGNFDSDGDGIWENYAIHDVITLFGGSAGAMLATQAATTFKMAGTFRRVIAESGTSVCPKLLSRNPREAHQQVLEGTSCSSLDCLKEKSFEELIDVATTIEKGSSTFPTMYTFAPWPDTEAKYEDSLQKADPFKIFDIYRSSDSGKDEAGTLSTKTFQYKDLMIGFNTGEGSLILSTLRRLATKAGYDLTNGIGKNVVRQFLMEYVKDYFPNNQEEVTQKLEELYFPGDTLTEQDTTEQAVSVINAYTDLLFASPAVALLDLHSHTEKNAKTRTYFYVFNHLTNTSAAELPPWFTMTPHTDERTFVFGEFPSFYNITDYHMTPEEVELKEQMMNAWVNFAGTGNPNNSTAGAISWPQYAGDLDSELKVFGEIPVGLSDRLQQIRSVAQLKDDKRQPNSAPGAPDIGVNLLVLVTAGVLCSM